MKNQFLLLASILAVAAPAYAEGLAIDEGDLIALDADGDGAVSKAEYDTFVGFAFEQIDKDGSGALSADEVDDHVVGDAFKMLDDDGDGLVSAREFTAQMNEDFAAADQDGDGSLN